MYERPLWTDGNRFIRSRTNSRQAAYNKTPKKTINIGFLSPMWTATSNLFKIYALVGRPAYFLYAQSHEYYVHIHTVACVEMYKRPA